MAPTRRTVILVVDDHADTADLIALVLRRSGFEVHTALGCRDGLRTALVYGCDLLVSDLNLGDGDGCALLRALCVRGPLPAVAVTGLADEEIARRARRSGFGVVLPKPFGVNALVTAVRAVLNARVAGE